MLSSKQKKVLLVDGYIREQEKLLNLSHVIPKPINAVIFEYQLLVETWNKELSDSNATISDDGGCININCSSQSKILFAGTHIVKCGEHFEWTLKIMEIVKSRTYGMSMFIGLLPEEHLPNSMRPARWFQKGGMGWLTWTGFVGCENKTWPFSESRLFEKKGDVLNIQYNSNGSIDFTANGQKVGINKKQVKITPNKDTGLRLLIHVSGVKHLKMMVDGQGLYFCYKIESFYS